MLGATPDRIQRQNDARPAKRPRNVSFSAEMMQSNPGIRATTGREENDQGMGMDTRPELSRASRQEDAPQVGPSTTSKARSDEKNNRKLSCKECRRLKLKCDRVFPCQSCIKRGCASLCPDGSLTSGRGSRFILAGAEQLHEKISELSDRVRQLEEAVEVLQAKVSNEPHPLLAPALLKIKTSQELYGSPPSHPATTSVTETRDENLRLSVGSLTLNTQPPYAEGSRPAIDVLPATMPNVKPDILQLSATFPFPWAVDVSIRKRIRDELPPKSEALRLCEQARDNALWQFNIDSSETFLPNLLHYCYETGIEALSPRRLALLLMHLSIGSLVDLSRPMSTLYGEAYHHLARAAVCEIPLMEEPDFDVLHALFFMIWYHLIFSDNKKAIGYAWNLMGFVAKLAQGLGLHKESPRLKVIPEEHEKRRAVFWELLNMDCRMSLSLGRPPSISLNHVDVKPPTYVGPGLYVPKWEIVYHEWKNNFFRQCLTPMLEAMVAAEQPDYAIIMDLDKSVRDFGIPSLLDEQQQNEVNPRFLVMQRGLVAMSREIALLQLHRRYFTEAMNRPGSFNLNHEYAASVIATYHGAANLISAVEAVYNQEAQLSVRFLYFWFNSFSAIVTLALLISRAPSSPLATYALQDMEKGLRLFRSAASILPFSGKALPVMQNLIKKAQRTLLAHRKVETSGTTHTRYSIVQPELPPPFKNAHSVVKQIAEKITIQDGIRGVNEGSSSHQSQSHEGASSEIQQEPWLPDIYHFSSMGLSVEERYSFALAQPTPFIPASPRVAENETFNFDHGELSSNIIEETSFMAWF
ncbi:hypothetical protein CPC08DRAFT_664768 [Agrocybe pediades]|nr:hypothetical protein CPC08DRAFT_664768 [Agrocybe pediades]